MASVNTAQVERVAEIIKKMPDDEHGMNFYSFPGEDGKEVVASDMYPELNHPQAINFFFFTSLHNFGFWYGDDRGYVEPLYGIVNGKQTKGAELLFKVCKKALDADSFAFSSVDGFIFEPVRLAKISITEFMSIFSDDNGPIPFPDFEERFRMTRSYGKWFVNFGKYTTSPQAILNAANKSNRSLDTFLAIMRQVAGYNGDELEKRQLLLAMELANRPEKFLKVNDPESWEPIVDYHLMRVSLRLGVVDVSEFERNILAKREWVSGSKEAEIRGWTRTAVKDLINKSGKSMSYVDHILWKARKYCPEMEKPDCPKCVFYEVCEKNIKLFQPVFRTTAY